MPRLRALRSVLSVLGILGLVASTAPVARAGDYTTVLCGSSTEILAFFASLSDFSGVDNCEGLCRSAHVNCRFFLDRSKSCEKASVNQDNFFAKAETCAALEDSSERKACRQELNALAKSLRLDIKNETSAARGICGELRDDCIAACSAPVE